MDLSVLIPARNEDYLLPTINTILAARERSTEIIVVADGQWPVEPIPDHPDVHLIYHPQSIGQRAATNEAARAARGTFVMKLDAHCMVGPGFDRLLIEPYEDGTLDRTVTTMPRLYNLHVFDWVCPSCGLHFYQGPEKTECGSRDDKGTFVPKSGCGAKGPLRKELIWQPRWNRMTDHMRFDQEMKFQYWKDYKRRPDANPANDFPELMGNLGACIFMKRDRFFELGGMDEAHGSWGQFGTEISCKSWLSGGRQVTNRRTWYSHLFRTQPGFSFPYPNRGRDQDHARDYSRKLWLGNYWPGQIRPLSWLIRKFWPVPDWSDPGPAPTPGAVYFTDSQLDPAIGDPCRAQLLRALPSGTDLVSVSLQPLDLGRNVVLPLERSRLTMFRQILQGLETSTADHVFLCEHDVLYHPSHFDFIPPRDDTFYYNAHVWRVRMTDGFAVTYDMHSVSGLCANRQLLLSHYRKLVEGVSVSGYDHKLGYEPGLGTSQLKTWRSAQPNVDLRHGKNLTASRWHPSEFRDISTCQGWQVADVVPGWGRFPTRLQELN